MPTKKLPTLGNVQTALPTRTYERKQGCWNCSHFDRELAKKWWSDKRQQDLEIALATSITSAMGEEDLTVKNIRRMVDQVDHAMADGSLGKCVGHGVDAKDNPVGDLVKNNYLCRKWNGATGASVARGGEAADPLPMELEDEHKN